MLEDRIAAAQDEEFAVHAFSGLAGQVAVRDSADRWVQRREAGAAHALRRLPESSEHLDAAERGRRGSGADEQDRAEDGEARIQRAAEGGRVYAASVAARAVKVEQAHGLFLILALAASLN